MNAKTAKLFFGVVLICVLTANSLHAQDAQVKLSGTITDSSGQVLANAKVTVRNSSTVSRPRRGPILLDSTRFPTLPPVSTKSRRQLTESAPPSRK